MEMLPITGQHMIVNHINDNGCITTLRFPKAVNTLFNNGMFIREIVNGAMEPNSVCNSFRVTTIWISFHSVCNEVAEKQFVIVRSKKNVAEEVQRMIIGFILITLLGLLKTNNG